MFARLRRAPILFAAPVAAVGFQQVINAEAAKNAELLATMHTSLSLGDARAVADSAIRAGRRYHLLPLAVVVLDAGGHDVVVLREDGCGIMRTNIARGKAYACLSMVRVPSAIFKSAPCNRGCRVE